MRGVKRKCWFTQRRNEVIDITDADGVEQGNAKAVIPEIGDGDREYSVWRTHLANAAFFMCDRMNKLEPFYCLSSGASYSVRIAASCDAETAFACGKAGGVPYMSDGSFDLWRMPEFLSPKKLFKLFEQVGESTEASSRGALMMFNDERTMVGLYVVGALPPEGFVWNRNIGMYTSPADEKSIENARLFVLSRSSPPERKVVLYDVAEGRTAKYAPFSAQFARAALLGGGMAKGGVVR